ncbi:hypothetical protein CDL15_Pgr008128 [Punica granatum]|uniref:HMA domain-containing protein n=1 Tax=Punica granatum TaxID=22663 RepID=A0A218VSW8_PUNGR|nr:hypothetical protein CDL15_Pgr008128 [Punica granatum]PKI37823.1 hypothetical protein CRG98_041773 [Punica granatum]
MRGFMCQSVEATSVCTIADPRSVIVPRKPDKTLVENNRLLSSVPRYSQLAEWTHNKRFNPEARYRRSPSVLVPSFKREDYRQNNHSSGRCDPIKQLTLGSSSSDNVFQVVVMRVSLHCQGCAGKVKKHISKMEGVTSYSIDLESKRVTVMGHVSPDGVLESISKIKRAEFWTN